MTTDLSKYGLISFWPTDTQLANVAATSSSFSLQRLASETGVLSVSVSTALTATPGEIRLEGRMSSDHGWAELARRDFNDLVAVAGQKAISTVDVPLAPEVRVRLVGNTGVTPNTTLINVRLGF